MMGGPSVSLWRDLQVLFESGTAAGLSDRQLLERCAGRRDASAEAAFELLVLRHGPMVWRVCRNLLPDPNDAQDAFQATFLILVRRCRTIRKLESVGSWLFGVASRVAARARAEAARRRAAERRGGLRVVAAVDSPDGGEPDQPEFGLIVQEEVRRLPEKYRAVVVLCYWEGLTQERAATQLGCPIGTVRSRLARARELLRRRLTRRGLAPLAGAVAAGLESASASAAIRSAVPGSLVSSTIKAGAHVAAGRAMTDMTSASVAALVQFVLRSLVMTKFRTAAIGLVLVGIGALGVSLAEPQADSKRVSPAAGQGTRPSGNKAQPPPIAMDSYIVEPPDVLRVEVLEALPGRPISGARLVRPDGKISLGFYGEIYVAGMTPIEIKEEVIRHLRKYLADETLGIVEIDPKTGHAKLDPKTGEPVLIKDLKDSDRVFVDVARSDSKFYYVLGEVVVPGRLPITGNETILDAISRVGGLTPRADHANVVLYRPAKGGPLRRLPVNIDQIMLGNDPTTDYQLEPGDRLVVPRSRGNESDAAEPEDERASVAPRPRSGDPRDFGRRPEQPGHAIDEGGPRQVDRADDRAALRGIERRLGAVERKLDMILDALKSRTR